MLESTKLPGFVLFVLCVIIQVSRCLFSHTPKKKKMGRSSHTRVTWKASRKPDILSTLLSHSRFPSKAKKQPLFSMYSSRSQDKKHENSSSHYEMYLQKVKDV